MERFSHMMRDGPTKRIYRMPDVAPKFCDPVDQNLQAGLDQDAPKYCIYFLSFSLPLIINVT